MEIFFERTSQDGRARAGVLHTAHGDVETPVFMPVGTQATVKALDSRDLAESGAEIILANTYHLHLRPDEDVIARAGGIHKFMNWNRALLTDSGGFQVFSLAQKKHTGDRHPTLRVVSQSQVLDQPPTLVSIDDDGVTFRSHLDGSTHRFTPEESIMIQKKIGADIIMAFDECTPDDADRARVQDAMDRTHAWAERSLAEHKKNPESIVFGNDGAVRGHRQFLFGIIQGGSYKDLREESARAIATLPFDGIAIGGESIGYNMSATAHILDWLAPLLPENKPRYTMGVGVSPLDLFEVVERGVDMFDCVAPTRMARNGSLYLKSAGVKNKFRLNITNAQFSEDQGAIDPDCRCFTCVNHTRAYLHHLFKAEELLAYRLATIHNIHFLLSLMQEMRQNIKNGKFREFKQSWVDA
ncbi:MAG: Queuine tRNA-ribosyltransferase [Candidatus Magasanikbacteria bacterium]|nr:Queuine tRNA-ribosyltransferase [Candidatus Magasanikbacteria bacterium]